MPGTFFDGTQGWQIVAYVRSLARSARTAPAETPASVKLCSAKKAVWAVTWCRERVASRARISPLSGRGALRNTSANRF